jgi:predicted HicB family RNase H-like nuclease
MTILKYKDYAGSADLDMDRGVLRGKILFIGDLVTYEAPTVKELQQEFEAAVDDYVDTCKEIGKAPQKSFTGVFNVRIEPECHKALAMLAAIDGRTLNAVVAEALHGYVNDRGTSARKGKDLHRPVAGESPVSEGIASSTQTTRWESLDVQLH